MRPASNGQRHRREEVAVEVIVDVKVARKAGARAFGLVPRSVAALAFAQIAQDPVAPPGVAPRPGKLQRVHGPGRLRRRAPADAGKRFVGVGMAALAPAAVGVLHRDSHAAARSTMSLAGAQRGERRDDAPGSVDVVDAPASEPRAARLLRRAKILQARARRNGLLVS